MAREDQFQEDVSPTATAEPAKKTRSKKADDAPADIEQRIEAALLSTDRPIAAAKLGEALGVSGQKAVGQAIESLNDQYETTGRAFRIEQVAGGWQIMTLPQYEDVLSALNKTREKTHLSPAALETLAIIAYKQPILRAEIETIRGVASGEMVRSLMERNMVKIVGRAEELGRPMLYGTTKQFLEVFGLSSLKDLPKAEEFNPPKAKASEEKPPTDESASDDHAASVEGNAEEESV